MFFESQPTNFFLVPTTLFALNLYIFKSYAVFCEIYDRGVRKKIVSEDFG